MEKFDPNEFVKNLDLKTATEKFEKVLLKTGIENSLKPTNEDIREYQGFYK